MQEEQVTCRICSAPAEPDQPLFHPCKCSGTIRYIHQDCLTTWLAHSKKKTCDICKYPYSFTKVYSPDMPERLPIVLLIRQLSRQAVSAVIFCTRAVLVGFIWLAILPWATIWTWRMYFALGDSTAWWISNRPRPESHKGPVLSNASSLNSTYTFGAHNGSLFIFSHPVVRAVTSDIVSGQIIAALIVLAFVAIFLLREWISQNARPGVFEEVDAPPPLEDILQDLEAIRIPALPLPAPPADDGIRHVDTHVRQGEPLKDGPNKRLRQDDNDDVEHEKRPSRKGKGKHRAHGELGSTSAGFRKQWSSPMRTTSSVFGGSETDEDDVQHNKQERLRKWAEHTATLRDVAQPLNLNHEQAQFTFSAPSPLQSGDVRMKDVTPHDSASDSPQVDLIDMRDGASPANAALIEDMASAHDIADTRDSPATASPLDESHPRSGSSSSWSYVSPPSKPEHADTPEKFTPPTREPASPSTAELTVAVAQSPSSFSPSSAVETLGSLRRPPLPSVTLPPSTSSPSVNLSRSRGPTPLASPNLATYRPPEEFEAGPSSLAGYFDSDQLKDDDDGDMDEEHRRYFTSVEAASDDVSEVIVDQNARYGEWIYRAEEIEDNVDPVGFRDRVDEPEIPAVPARVDRNAPQPEENADAPPPEPNEEMDVNMDDDMDGALEAIGLRGPLQGVLQNAALMIFILNTTIGLGVWLPFTIGKSAALLSLDPPRLLQIIHLPLRIIRLITDPVVDSVMMLVTQLLIPSVVRSLTTAFRFMLKALGRVIGYSGTEKVVEWTTLLYNHVVGSVNSIWDEIAARVSSHQEQSSSQPTFSLLSRIPEDSAIMQFLEPSFAPLGKKVRLAFAEAKVTWDRLAIGNGPHEKVFAIALGYTVVGLLLAIYLNVLTVGNVKNAGRAVRNAVRQQLLIIKVAAFIVIELVIFPLGCGVMLDACTVWLLPQGNFRSRTAYLLFAPVTSIFYHWVIGTMFMYQFAVLLAGCRGIMRPGAMWFIKDPQDQNFHPIRDILERPTLVQVRKLLLSAFMYALVVAAGVGTVSGVLQLFSRTILPFRWKIREPLSAVPIDMLFLHLVLPYTLQYFRPKKAMRQFGTYLWKYLAAQLRLSSYMLGGRFPSEEYTPAHWSWRMLFISSTVEIDDAEATHDGTFRRVPNSDNVALVKDFPATAEVDEEGRPTDAKQAKFIALQNAEAEKAKRNVKDDYTVVYIPPHFKYRVAAFLLAVWIVGSIILGLALGVPVLLGRGFFGLFTSREVHDGYSFIAGFYLLWACLLVGHTIDRMDKRRQRRGGNEPRAEWPLYLAKRSLLWIAQMSYMGFFLGFVIPTLIALVMEVYIVQPIRQIANSPPVPRIRIVDQWALGLMYSKIIIRCLRMQPGNDFIVGIDHIKRQGWTHPDPFRATKEVIAPVTFGLLGMLVLPAGVLYAVRRVLQVQITDDFLFMNVYPSIFTVVGFGHATVVLSKAITSWSQGIRDKEFLVEMRLQNLDAESDEEKDREKDKEVEIEVRDDEEEEEE